MEPGAELGHTQDGVRHRVAGIRNGLIAPYRDSGWNVETI